MIHFQCQHCDAKLKVPETHAGKQGSCPRCQSRIVVPPAPEPDLELVKEDAPASAPVPSKLLEQLAVQPPLPAGKDGDSPEDRLAPKLLGSTAHDSAPEYTGVRRFPWPLDVLLYPANEAGLTTLAILVGVPLVLAVAERLLPVRLPFFGSPLFVIRLLLGLYGWWYFAECVHDSARGGTRAPQVLDISGLSEIRSRIINLMGVLVLFAWPPGLYRIWTHQTDTLFLVLVAWAVVFSPMGLLAMTMLDSTEALNPLFLLGSILRVFLPYFGLLLLLASLIGLAWLLPHGPVNRRPPLWSVAIYAIVGGYGGLIVAHFFGRFYWRYRERLDWGI